MKIAYSPERLDDALTLARYGDTLEVNGEAFDLTDLPEGGLLPAEAISSDWFVGPVVRENGVLVLTLRLPHGPNAPTETLFPAPITVAGDGPIAVPAYDIPPTPEEATDA